MSAGQIDLNCTVETPGQGGFDASYVAYQFDLNTTRFYRPATQDTAAAWYTGHNHHRTGAYTINERVTYEWNPLHTSTAGINLRYDDIRSNALRYYRCSRPNPDPRMAGLIYAIPRSTQHQLFLRAPLCTSGLMRVTAGCNVESAPIGRREFCKCLEPWG